MCDYVWANGKLIAKIVPKGGGGGAEAAGGEDEGIESEGGGPPPIPPDSDKVYYYHLDHLGTPLVLTGTNRQLRWGTNYLPFGKLYSELADSASNEVRFPGQYHDEETDLYYNWHRYYEPNLGRYYQADPIGLFGGINLYINVDNNPQRWVDPKGLQIFGHGSYGYPIFDYRCALRVREESIQRSSFSGLQTFRRDNTPWNAYLHCLWNCEMTQQCGWSTALLAGTGHEFLRGSNTFPYFTIPYFSDMWPSRIDLFNNAEGRDCARKIYLDGQNCKYTDCDKCCRDKLKSQDLIFLLKR